MAKTIKKSDAAITSERETIQNNIVSKLTADGRWNAPFGVLTSIAANKAGPYRSVTFGRARTLDCEIRIYGPEFILVRWNSANRSFPQRGKKVFTNVTELMFFIYELGGLHD